MPNPNFATIATVLQAISDLLIAKEPVFLAFGLSLFRALALILVGWEGITIMLTGFTPDRLYSLVKLVFFLSIGYALIAFYDAPLPGIGVSFSNLITDQTAYFANVLDARSLELTFTHLDTLFQRFVLPDTWSIAANLLYWSLLLVLAFAKAAALAVVAFGLIASAVCGLVGPIFVPFLIVPQLDWLFWGWFKAFLQYSFVPVIAFAYLMIGEQLLFRFVSTLPQGITDAQYPLYVVAVLTVVGTFVLGVVLVPVLTSSIFSGHATGANGGFVAALMTRR